MLITLCYVYMWVRFHKCYSALIRRSLCKLKSRSFSFRCSLCTGSPGGHASGRPQFSPLPPEGDTLFLQLGTKSVYVTEPQACGDISDWTVLSGSDLWNHQQVENVSFIIEAAGHRADSPPSTTRALKWSDYCLPLACSPGQPFRVVAQTSRDNFSLLGVAFIEDRLHLDDGLVPSKIIPVRLLESSLSEVLEKQSHPVPKSSDWLSDHHHSLGRKGRFLSPEASRRLEERRGSAPVCGCQDLVAVGDAEDRSLGHHHQMEGHGHHLHLSSCHECLELENSTILSVKYASVENIPDLPDDNWDLDGAGDTEAGHGPGGLAGGDHNCKPPNVLVYTGGCQERFQALSQLLSECINTENNIIYHLLPQQVLADPWLENTKLLVLAEEEPLTPQLQACFLTYLSKGGRVLGLASSLCPAGICLEGREGQRKQVRTLAFTREDSVELELSLMASGKVYLRDVRGGGEVELWGELKSDLLHQRDMVIVRVTHEEDGGEAVLCQVHLEVSPDSKHLSSEGFNKLKVSNGLRYEVLTEILTSLGINCNRTQIPALSPVHLLATHQDAKAAFLEWLKTRADQNGVLTFSKAALRMVSSSELQAPEGQLTLVAASDQPQKFPHFCLETYGQNLRTDVLGRTLLYAEVATSTMDLLEGLTLHAPKDVGLIAIAAQQIQGRGRGRNAWLGPLGCAMFTVGLQVELSSRLGRRIPFLQHLAALAVVEAVRTLPGYQDIDLRVKWPNDVYYSNLIKLGGVLVTSTLMGSTFHLLIGCGFNVTNSNPTACINDLIQRHNLEHGCSLEPLGCDQLIGRTVGCLETLISSFQRGGADAVLPLYYRRWLHGGTTVRLWSEDGVEAEVVGLDHNGFLQVYNKDQGLLSLEPDGNSFDMLKNLLVLKQQ